MPFQRNLDVGMKSANFRVAAAQALAPAAGTYIYEASIRELENKTSAEDPAGYVEWLDSLLRYISNSLSLEVPRVLDLGCGTGEFTVMMNLLGFPATGLDVSSQSLKLARLLARENGLRDDIFLGATDAHLPIADNSVDIVVLISALEHIDDKTLVWLVPELARVCRGAVFVQVPSAMKLSDDHTGLKFVPWLPPKIAEKYIALRGERYRYLISDSGKWDVVYRNLDQIEQQFSQYFLMQPVPPAFSFPKCAREDAVLDPRKRVSLGRLSVNIRIPIIWRWLQFFAGKRVEHFYPYYNVLFRKRNR